MLQEIPWMAGVAAQEKLPPRLAEYDQAAAELRANELDRLASGEEPPDLAALKNLKVGPHDLRVRGRAWRRANFLETPTIHGKGPSCEGPDGILGEAEPSADGWARSLGFPFCEEVRGGMGSPGWPSAADGQRGADGGRGDPAREALPPPGGPGACPRRYSPSPCGAPSGGPS